jgi:predicted GTPase
VIRKNRSLITDHWLLITEDDLMSRWRIAVVAVLVAVPLIVLIGLGSYFLWQTGYGFWIWWPMFACASLGYFLAWFWLRKRTLIAPIDFTPSLHWTQRDQEAWKLVEARAQELAGVESTAFNELQHYANLAQEMALELARFYHPDAKDPIGVLTVPEVLAVIELAAQDLAELVDQNVPASHLLTINDWRWTRLAAEQATTWYRRASNIFWLASAVFAPLETAARYAATQAGAAKPMQLFQQNLVAWFHLAFVHRLGSYLIELNSGRLRVGARRYRELKAALDPALARAKPGAEPDSKPVELVTLTVIGQTKVGKSSFINALLGEQRARTDVVPVTDAVTRYELPLAGSTARLVLLDTAGYAHSGPKEDQLRATESAAQKSDLLILVLHARNPARQADLEMLQGLHQWYTSRPELKPPPILAVLTHVDLLSPAMEWSPPYDWQKPQRAKEKNMQEALTAVRDQLGAHLVGAVPVCAAPGKVYGVEDWFLPTLVELLGEARAVAMLRCLRDERDAVKVRKTIDQVLKAGVQVLDLWFKSQQPQNVERGAHSQK